VKITEAGVNENQGILTRVIGQEPNVAS